MPNIPPLISAMPDNQPLYAAYTNDTPADPVLQNSCSVPVPCTGTGTLPDGTEVILFTGVVPYAFGGNSWNPLVFVDAGFSYTATTTTGSIAFKLKLGGSLLQTITQTPNTTAQTVAFTQYSTLLPAVTGSGTYVVAVTATATGATTITATNSQSLYGAVVGCKPQ